MLYCDLTIDSAVIWTGVPCLNCVAVNSYPYLNFFGYLFFVDTQGITDPSYLGLNDRFVLFYAGDTSDSIVVVPLQATPAQTLNVILGGQNCTLSFYDKSTPDEALGPVVSWDCPATLQADTGTVHNVTVTAPAGCAFDWTIYIPIQPDVDASIYTDLQGYGTAVYPSAGGLSRSEPGNVSSLEVTGISGVYEFFMYLICDVYLEGGVSRLSQRILVSGDAEVIWTDNNDPKWFWYNPDGHSTMYVIVTGGTSWHWSIVDNHGGLITLDDPDGSSQMLVGYEEADTTFTLHCLVDGTTLLSQLVTIGIP